VTMIFLNIAWMKNYDGETDDDKPIDGGIWDEKNEVCNFANVNSRCYGFVYPKNLGPINIDRIGADPTSEKIHDVTVIWTAKHDNFGTVVVGWYNNATLYRNPQQVKNSPQHHKNNVEVFYAECSFDDATLLPERQRTFQIPRGEGGMGQYLIWYADNKSGPQTKQKLSKYIDEYLKTQKLDTSQISRMGGGVNSIGAFDPAFDALIEDVAKIENADDSPTEKATLIKARLGQGKFRKYLDMFWNESCAVTGCNIRAILRASHIKAWRECINNKERLDPDNGLLLCAHLDALFDKGLISFSDTGAMLVSKNVPDIEITRLGLTGSITKRLNDGQKRYLATHRERFHNIMN
jgi:HNH endonuclease